jgi:aspartyl/glutamyl-tRNA(Asn/Gln) amidotransferase C subunit
MKDEITSELFERLVELAAFAFDPTEAEYLRGELNSQLRAIHQLETVSLDDEVPPASHGVPYTDQSSPPLREDKWVRCENPEEILAQAPQMDDGYFIVPDKPPTKLD